MLPEDFKRRIACQEYIDAEALLKALEEPSPVSIRINPLKWDKMPLNTAPVPWCSTGFYLDNKPNYTLDPLFHAGCYYPQEAASMFIESAFRQAVEMDHYLTVLDLCGAPGGKSTHLSFLIGKNGLLVTNEVIRSRASILAENITKWGGSNTIVSQNDPAVFNKISGFFDVILVDAPCSGEGMFRDSIATGEWSEENTIHCSGRQRRILSDVWPALKEDGILIYSTCTFNPGENEQNIKWLTSEHEAVSVALNISDYEGITEIDFQGIRGYGFYPDKLKGEGFFISLVKKITKPDKVTIRERKRQYRKVIKDDLAVAKDWTFFQEENLIKTGNEIISVAGMMEDYLYLGHNLKIIKDGTRICTVKNNDYLPSHELALSEGLKQGAFPVAELDYNQALAYLRRDNVLVPDAPNGWFIVKNNGVNLGFCKNIGNRINNYYPLEWRIRMSVPKTGKVNITGWSGENLY